MTPNLIEYWFDEDKQLHFARMSSDEFLQSADGINWEECDDPETVRKSVRPIAEVLKFIR